MMFVVVFLFVSLFVSFFVFVCFSIVVRKSYTHHFFFMCIE